jgi:hypothetical protein
VKNATDQRAQVETEIEQSEADLQKLQSSIAESQEENRKLTQMTADLGANIVVTKIVVEINKAKSQTLESSAGLLESGGNGVDAGDLAAKQSAADEQQQKLSNLIRYFRERFPDAEAFHPELWASFYQGVGV